MRSLYIQIAKNEWKRKFENEKRNKFTKINFDVGAEQKSKENSIVSLGSAWLGLARWLCVCFFCFSFFGLFVYTYKKKHELELFLLFECFCFILLANLFMCELRLVCVCLSSNTRSTESIDSLFKFFFGDSITSAAASVGSWEIFEEKLNEKKNSSD